MEGRYRCDVTAITRVRFSPAAHEQARLNAHKVGELAPPSRGLSAYETQSPPVRTGSKGPALSFRLGAQSRIMGGIGKMSGIPDVASARLRSDCL